MFERLMTKGEAVAQRRVRAVRNRLSNADMSDGVAVVPSETGIILSGRGLRMRVITDIRLRSFADLVRRMVP